MLLRQRGTSLRVNLTDNDFVRPGDAIFDDGGNHGLRHDAASYECNLRHCPYDLRCEKYSGVAIDGAERRVAPAFAGDTEVGGGEIRRWAGDTEVRGGDTEVGARGCGGGRGILILYGRP